MDNVILLAVPILVGAGLVWLGIKSAELSQGINRVLPPAPTPKSVPPPPPPARRSRVVIELRGNAHRAVWAFSTAAEIAREHDRIVAEAGRVSCDHVWPSELEPDALCDNGCGATYALWSE